ncbi:MULTISPECIES: hypothetical protein [Mycolicibacterium]|jgi:hypothetical protein|uniref:hypothetical protein n=1 Tax=Mycolicibacterium TaxID=1866885 RepID=UPI0005662B14|nr:MULTISPECIES: hypothetical protein [Mycolicibacterium]MDW5614702.1 hypothetical protein [Mycolicibacterium sp. D5.8-2]PQP42175.1 hypothetical protein C6A88_26870 [Mycolicibacterium austroafricanum]QRZ04577.1 hypothetical protein JN090_16265 [Mycolicibacterium austroafricanum]QZT66310.1 hypothetical protein JN086_17175 [Mycolicibacterium austroafricanum]QZY44106.1 hypothetical protein K5L12_17525 [Mycolicibacterium austroafricanum]
MRIAALIAMSALVAACSQSVGGEAESSRPSAATPPVTTSPAPTPPVSQQPTAAPAQGASIDDVISWIGAGTPTDPAGYHVAFRDGVTTRLGEDIAFTAPSGAPHSSTQCITSGGALTCLLDLTAPPPRPAQAEGAWKPGWVEFTGTGLSVGSLRGDPGPFLNGAGAQLPPGQSLTFGDNRCRGDATGLLCVNYAHRSAVRLAADGVVAYGCLAEVTPPPESAAAYSC